MGGASNVVRRTTWPARLTSFTLKSAYLLDRQQRESVLLQLVQLSTSDNPALLGITMRHNRPVFQYRRKTGKIIGETLDAHGLLGLPGGLRHSAIGAVHDQECKILHKPSCMHLHDGRAGGVAAGSSGGALWTAESRVARRRCSLDLADSVL